MESTNPVEPSAVIQQPGTSKPPEPGTEQGPVYIRNIEAQDVEFVARILVEAFHDKVEHAVGKSRMEDMIQLTASGLAGAPELWHRYFVAMYDGRVAGSLVIKFHDSPDEDLQSWFSNSCSHIGCCGTCRVLFMASAITNTRISPTQCYVDTVGVDAEYRGKGIGTALLDRADSEARERGCTTAVLWVTQSNRAVRLYERHGYVITHPFGGCITQCAVGTRDWYNMEKQL